MDHANDTLGIIGGDADRADSRTRKGDQTLCAQSSDAADGSGVALPALDAKFWEQRDRELKKVLPLYPDQLAHDRWSVAALIVTLERAVAAEIRRREERHFAYQAGRFTAIKSFLKRERLILSALQAGAA